MGTSSKWALEWVEKYQAYKIHAMTDGEKDAYCEAKRPDLRSKTVAFRF